MVKPLIWGVDTLYLTFRAPVDASWLERLAAAKIEARQRLELGSHDPVVVQCAGRACIVRPQSAPPYRYMIHVPDELDARVAGVPSLPGETPTVVVELRSALLWRGYERAAELAHELARDLLGAPEACAVACARIDLCCDFQGWIPDGTDEESTRFARKLRKGWVRWGEGTGFTGYSMGTGAQTGRLYDKTEEIAQTDKGWFRDLWSAAGYDPESPVFRLETQTTSEALSEMGLRDDWIGNLSARLDELWSYAWGRPDWHPERLTGTEREIRALKAKAARLRRAGQDLAAEEAAQLVALELERNDEQRHIGAWVSLRERREGSPRAEWPVDPAWRELQRVTFVAPSARASRNRQRETKIENCVMQIRGLLSTVAAHAGVRPRLDMPTRRDVQIHTLHDSWVEVQRRLLRLDELEPRDFTARVEEKIPLVPSSPADEQPAPAQRLPTAPWEPERDRLPLLPYQLPSLEELRAMPRPQIPEDQLPRRPWQEVAPQQIELSEVTIEWQRALASHDAEADRRLRKRLRFAAAPVEKQIQKVRP